MSGPPGQQGNIGPDGPAGPPGGFSLLYYTTFIKIIFTQVTLD